MSEQTRKYPLFSACGLNCGLCPNHYTNGPSRCAGCGGENFFYPSCGILACNLLHDGIEFCFLCDEYPCKRYDGADEYDSFITHRRQMMDNDKARQGGLGAYKAELEEKMEILRALLDGYNDGRRKNLYCIAVNLLELPDLRAAMAQIEAKTAADELSEKEKAAIAAARLQAAADARGITLKLNKKSKK